MMSFTPIGTPCSAPRARPAVERARLPQREVRIDRGPGVHGRLARRDAREAVAHHRFGGEFFAAMPRAISRRKFVEGGHSAVPPSCPRLSRHPTSSLCKWDGRYARP